MQNIGTRNQNYKEIPKMCKQISHFGLRGLRGTVIIPTLHIDASVLPFKKKTRVRLNRSIMHCTSPYSDLIL